MKNIPTIIEDSEILDFLKSIGVPTSHPVEYFKMTKSEQSTSVIVEQKYFDTPIYCKPIRRMIPIKQNRLPTESHSTPKANDPSRVEQKGLVLIPGLSKSQQKKALKRAKDKRNKELKEDDKYPQNRLDFLKKDLAKCGLEVSYIEEQYDFE